MSGDYSRLTFDPRRDFAGVLSQQGRVQTDSDANEDGAALRRRAQAEALDTIGPSGVPAETPDGFKVGAAAGKLTIAPGRMYVDGLLAENHGEDPPIWRARLAEMPGTGATPYDNQPYYPSAPALPAGAGPHLAYLKVWQREVTSIEDPLLIEPALGVDTTARLQTVWQVKVLPDVGATVNCSTALSAIPEFTEAEPGAGGRLTTKTVEVPGQPNPCEVPPGGGYKGSENQLYRVEIHAGGGVGAGGARFKWSRDNATVATRITHINKGNELVVESIGRDAELSFSNGDWVEITDDWLELNGLPGEMRRIRTENGVDEATRTITLEKVLPAATFPVDGQGRTDPSRNTRLKRWDQRGRVLDDGGNLHFDLDSTDDGTIPVTTGTIQLEHGVVVEFSQEAGDGILRPGEWWCFAARQATGTIEELDRAPAKGTHAHYAKLALVTFPSNATDCRPIFDPLTDRTSLFYVSGDTQQALPSVTNPAALVPLPHDLVVGVANGGRPLAGAGVRFLAAQGRLAGTGADVTVTTGADGLAAIKWELNSADQVQTATATLLKNDGTPRGLPVQFSATLSVAEGVAYKPDKCDNLAGTATVQEALDRLCNVVGGGCDTLSLAPGAGWVEALEKLPARSDATVCFKPGEYETNRPVVLKDLGNIRLNGAGRGTRIIGRGAESALVFQKCGSIHLSNLSVEIEAYPPGPVTGMLGSVTAVDCNRVDLEQVRLICPTGADKRGTCLTVRNGGGDSDAQTVLRSASVRVRDCELIVGHSQTGVLVVNSERVSVTGSEFRTPPLPPGLGVAGLLTDKMRLNKAVEQLVGRLVIDKRGAVEMGNLNTAFKVADYVVRLNSPVPEAEWQALVKSNPPTASETASPEALTGYVEKLVNSAAEDSRRLPSYNKIIAQLTGRLGGGRFLTTPEGRASVRSFLASDVDVEHESKASALSRSVSVPTSKGTLRFDSPLAQTTWNNALRAMPGESGTAVGAAKQVKAAARRILLEPAFANRIAPNFMATLGRQNLASAACGVRVAGTVLGEVAVEGNSFVSTTEAVHVATSFRPSRGMPTRSVRSVRISHNDIHLSVPFELDASPRAVFVGNAERIVACDNRSRVSSKRTLTGIQLEGKFGPHIVVKDNELSGCQVGVTVLSHHATPTPRLWLIADNVAPSTGPGKTVVHPIGARVQGNVP